MTTSPTPEAVAATAKTAGLDFTSEVAARISTAIGPAFSIFSAVSLTLPLDLEPATFETIQMRELSK